MTYEWDEPQTAVSPRGWCYSPRNTTPVGWYLQYDRPGYGRNADECILASAYWYSSTGRLGKVDLGCDWFTNIDDAKAFVEAKVLGYLEPMYRTVSLIP